jgi:hypothetical protein
MIFNALKSAHMVIVYKKYQDIKKILDQIVTEETKTRLTNWKGLRKRWNKGQYEPNQTFYNLP